MNYKKPLLVVGAASTITMAGITGLGAASADTSTTSTSTDPVSSLVDKIATKFNLNKADVKAVFDQDRATREAEHEKQTDARLTQDVTDGKITADQKTKIEAKLKELKAQRDANRASMDGKTDAERKAAMDAERTALDTWAKDNNIPIEYLHLGRGGHGGHGPDGEGPAITSTTNMSSSSTSN